MSTFYLKKIKNTRYTSWSKYLVKEIKFENIDQYLKETIEILKSLNACNK
ncbi:hypothetical protein [Campylobacter iguaniorum]|nr:hypothetical protein [Campylobacter iguaniorum]